MEVALIILSVIALIGVAWFLDRKPYTVIGKHHGGDADDYSDPLRRDGLKLDSGGIPNLDSGQVTGSGDSSCGDGGGGNQ